jgi:hypothetical protein
MEGNHEVIPQPEGSKREIFVSGLAVQNALETLNRLAPEINLAGKTQKDLEDLIWEQFEALKGVRPSERGRVKPDEVTPPKDQNLDPRIQIAMALRTITASSRPNNSIKEVTPEGLKVEIREMKGSS